MRDRKRYPKQWHRLATECKDRAGWRCSKCGIRQGQMRWSLWSGKCRPVWLQAAHVNHDPWNESPELACVCASCHWFYYRRPGARPSWLIEKLKHQKLLNASYSH
ncbi:MAG TPA: hypothetical protein VHV10_19660 [Ktedonobacteraceae bacterium]|nr:hypothetical protein [Ktedonobacteraceae bacterium]